MSSKRDPVTARQLAWADQALHWGQGARRMLEKPRGFVETQLGFVALSVSVANAVRLVDGIDATYRGDPLAQADCPMPHRKLRRIGRRIDDLRDERTASAGMTPWRSSMS